MNVIKEIKEYKYAPAVENKKKLDIAYGVDKKYLFASGISITSILLHNDNSAFAFHVFTDFLDVDNESKFKKLAKNFCADITLYLIDCTKLKNLPYSDRFNYSTYIRFIIADQLCDSKDKILYLDADIFCNGSIEALNDIELGGNACAVVKDVEKSESENAKLSMRLGIISTEYHYFNSGFLLLNPVYWKSHDVTHQAFTLLGSKKYEGKLVFFDQEVLNILFFGKSINISAKYNQFYELNSERKRKQKCALPNLNDSVLVHYIGTTKPWHSWANYAACNLFKQAKTASEWKDCLVIPPQRLDELRECAKHNFYQEDYINGIKNYAKYSFLKYKRSLSKRWRRV